jgi:type IV pilus assembly protein PilV
VYTRKSGGFSLIEVLAAVLVLSVGALGAAGAQLAALQTRQRSALMASGIELAASLAERMRANAAQTLAGDARNPYLQFQYDALGAGPPPPPAAMCMGATDCSSAQMAAFDLYEIADALHQRFPGGRVAVCRDAAVVAPGSGGLAWSCAGGAGAPIVIKLGWRARGSQAGDAGFAPALAIVAGGAAS